MSGNQLVDLQLTDENYTCTRISFAKNQENCRE